LKTLGIFARNPEPGKTKTRLAAAIGDEQAAELYACFVRDLIRRVQFLADQLWTAVTPDSPDCHDWYKSLPVDHGSDRFRMLIQPEGHLGKRIAWYFEEVAVQGGGSAVLIGTDNPDLPSSRIEEAFNVLSAQDADVVLVPSTDGGYVLIGMNGNHQGIFNEVRWSSPFTMLDTIAAAEAVGMTVCVLPLWYDVDHLEDLGTFAALQQYPGSTMAASCPETAHWLNGMLSQFGKG
jgi:rSAM/selenodomain-associated transferase 1